MLLMCITFQFKSGAPTQGISKRNSTDNASWGGAPTQGISKRNSTGNASWGGAPTQRISKRNSTNNVSWGGASTKRNWIPNFNRQCNICMTNQRYSFSFVFFILLNNN